MFGEDRERIETDLDAGWARVEVDGLKVGWYL